MTETPELPDADRPERRVRRAPRRWRSALLISVLVIVGFAATGVLPVREYVEREKRVEAAQGELDQLTEQNAALTENIDALLSEEGVERLAREQYGFVRPGEIGFVAIPPDAVPESSEAVGPEEVLPERVVVEDRSFFQGIWDFMTGRDRVHDG